MGGEQFPIDPDGIYADPIDFFAVLTKLIDIIPLWGWFVALIGVSLSVIIYYYLLKLLALVVFGMLHAIGYAVGIPISKLLNYGVSRRIRASAIGNDTRGEVAVDVASHPLQADDGRGALPPALDEIVVGRTDSVAAATLAKAREIVALSAQMEDDGSIVSSLVKNLSGDELVHTAYFEVDAFTRLVAYGLHRTADIPLRANAWTDADRYTAEQHYAELMMPKEASISDFSGVAPEEPEVQSDWRY